MRPFARKGRPAPDSAPLSEFETAFAVLYRERHPALFRYLDRSLGDPQLAADVAQEAFVRLLDRGSFPEEPGAWLVSVANNFLRDHFRGAGRRLQLLTAAGDDAPRPSTAPDPAVALDQDEQRRQVRSALNRLPPREREVLLLRHSGYSYREIAVALELTETNVSTILLRAGISFRQAYQELHGDPD
ncbi:MAG: sigma-70 family RNA polymerase sigma factor [Gemmatimonadota bacterium]